MEIEISSQIFPYSQISNFMKIRPVGAKLFHSERQVGGQKLHS